MSLLGRFSPFGEKQNLIQTLKKHPYIITFAVCMLVMAVTFCEQNYISPGNTLFIFSLLVICNYAISVFLSVSRGLKPYLAALLFVVLSVISYVFCYALRTSQRRGAFLFLCVAAVCAITFFVLLLRRKLTVNAVIALLFVLGYAIRLTYVLYTSVTTRQHDVYNFGDSGHSGYIRYFYENGKLPDFDVSIVDQFYHPPLHHIICALVWKALSLFGILDNYAQSSLQTLTLFYSSASLILSLRILKRFKLSGKNLVLAFAVLCFHPTFIIFSASINNDILSVTFMLLAVYYSLKWYESRSWRDIVVIAVSIGLGMMTKTSVYMICFGVAFLFLTALIKDKNNFKKYLAQFSVFLAICAPLALWWEVRNAALFGMPLTYVQRLPDNSWQYVGNHSVGERLFDFSKLFTAPVFDQWTNRGDMLYNEYNPMISLLKTSVFGEYINDFKYPSITVSANFLFWSNLSLALLSVVALGYLIIEKMVKKDFDVPFYSIVISNALMIAFYYIFCFSYPHHCTENIRYVSPLVVFGSLFIGKGLEAFGNKSGELKTKKSVKIISKVLNALAVVLVVVFAVSSVTMFLQIGLA